MGVSVALGVMLWSCVVYSSFSVCGKWWLSQGV